MSESAPHHNQERESGTLRARLEKLVVEKAKVVPAAFIETSRRVLSYLPDEVVELVEPQVDPRSNQGPYSKDPEVNAASNVSRVLEYIDHHNWCGLKVGDQAIVLHEQNTDPNQPHFPRELVSAALAKGHQVTTVAGEIYITIPKKSPRK